jgi:hypothetical protein
MTDPRLMSPVGRVLITKQVVQIVDLAADAAYLERDPARVAVGAFGFLTFTQCGERPER